MADERKCWKCIALQAWIHTSFSLSSWWLHTIYYRHCGWCRHKHLNTLCFHAMYLLSRLFCGADSLSHSCSGLVLYMPQRAKPVIHIPCIVTVLTLWTDRKRPPPPKQKCIILPRRPREGCVGSLIQQLGYVNKQFAPQRDDMTKELGRQNWISFDRMWLPLRLIDFHHRHLVEAFTTWNWEESAPIERKWQSNTNNGVSWKKFSLTFVV